MEEKRLCSDGCRKSLYGVLLTGAIFATAHRQAENGSRFEVKIRETRSKVAGQLYVNKQKKKSGPLLAATFGSAASRGKRG